MHGREGGGNHLIRPDIVRNQMKILQLIAARALCVFAIVGFFWARKKIFFFETEASITFVRALFVFLAAPGLESLGPPVASRIDSSKFVVFTFLPM